MNNNKEVVSSNNVIFDENTKLPESFVQFETTTSDLSQEITNIESEGSED